MLKCDVCFKRDDRGNLCYEWYRKRPLRRKVSDIEEITAGRGVNDD